MWRGAWNWRRCDFMKKTTMKNKGKNKKRRFDPETGKGNGYKVGRERFVGFANRTDGLKMDGFNDVRRSCNEWLDKNEDRSKAMERWRFNYGKNAGA